MAHRAIKRRPSAADRAANESSPDVRHVKGRPRPSGPRCTGSHKGGREHAYAAEASAHWTTSAQRRRRGAAQQLAAARSVTRSVCSPSRAFWGAPRAIVGLKRGGGGWCILASAMTERVVASSHANSRLPSKPSTRGGVGRRTLPGLKTNLLPCLGLLEYGRVRCVLPPGLALRRVRMRGRRSEYAEFPRGGRPQARPSAPGRPLAPTRTAPPPGPNAYSGEYGPELGRVIALEKRR